MNNMYFFLHFHFNALLPQSPQLWSGESVEEHSLSK